MTIFYGLSAALFFVRTFNGSTQNQVAGTIDMVAGMVSLGFFINQF
jgi:hypothetical protein